MLLLFSAQYLELYIIFLGATLLLAAAALSGARKNMEDKFYTPELASLVTNAAATFDFGGAPPPPAVTEQERLFRGPLAAEFLLPLTPANVAAIATLRSQAAAAWLAWQQDPAHLHRPGKNLEKQWFIYLLCEHTFSSARTEFHNADA